MYHEDERKGVSLLYNGTITTWTTRDGLRSDIVTATAPEGDAVWFCTERGLCRLDGSSWTNYPSNARLLSSTINDIAEDPSGTIWFATNRGLSRYDGAEWRTYTVDEGLPADVVKTVAAGNDGRIWVISDSTLVEFNGRTFIPHTTNPGINKYYLACITVDEINRVWTNVIPVYDSQSGKSSFVFLRYGYQGWEAIPGHEYSYRSGIRSAAMGENGVFWAGGYKGLVRLRSSTLSLWRTNTPDNVFSSHISVDSRNTKWINSSTSIFAFDDTSWETIPINDTFFSDQLIVDSRDRKWVCGMGGKDKGIVCIDGDTFSFYNEADGLPFSQYIGIKCYLDPFDTKWFYSTDNGVVRYDDSAWKHFTTADGLASNMISGMTVDSDHVAWFAGNWGISSFDDVKWTTYSDGDKLPLLSVSRIITDSKGTKWAVASSNLVRFDGVGWKLVSVEQGLMEPNVFSAIAGKGGVVFVSGRYSISRWDGSSWRQFPLAGTISYFGYEGYVDRKNRFWFSASVDGINRLVSCEGDSIRYHQPGTLYSAAEDRNGVLWFVVVLDNGAEILSYDGREVPESGARPKKVSLIGNYPNPFNAGTSIVFDLHSWGRATVDIHSITGQKVRTLYSGIIDAGRHEIVWDGTDDRGAKVSSGVYFARIRKDGAAETKKMMFVK